MHKPDYRYIAGFATVASGSAAVILFAIAQARILELENNSGYERYRAGFKTWEPVCERADQGIASNVMGATPPLKVRKVCSEAEAWEIVSYIAAPVGFAAIGVGAFLMFGSETVLGTKDVAIAPTPGGAMIVGRF